MQRRNKAGGIIDRRFGENDPTMTPEEKMLERFTKEKQKRVRGGDIFNIDGDEDQLTHFGKSLGGDDFDAGNEMMLSDDDMLEKRLKKRRLDEDAETGSDPDEETRPERKKSKAEVMKEVIAKSKLHKYERQKAKEDDEEEREKLDAQMTDIWALLGRQQLSRISGPGTGANMEPVPGRDEPKDESNTNINPDRLSQMEGKEDAKYDSRVREMVFDKRSQPAERTKTAEEKVLEESERLRKLEEARQRRMRGDEDSEDERPEGDAGGDDELEFGDAAGYGLGRGIPVAVLPDRTGDNPDELLDGDYEVSEDGYVDVDEDGVVGGSGAESSDDFDQDEEVEAGSGDDEEDDFLADLIPSKNGPRDSVLELPKPREDSKADKLAFTFPCPQTHEEMLEITKDIPVTDVPTVVQRIRVLHHPKLHAENKTKLAEFSSVLLEHIIYTANLAPASPPFAPLETLIRHLHALSKSYPERVAAAFRTHLTDLHSNRTTGELTAGDLVLFTAIGTIFPTSDHFHQVVTPAMIVICKWLGQVPPTSIELLGMGTYLVTLCVQYQKLSKRFVPEAINYILQALSLLAPVPQTPLPGYFPYHESAEGLRMRKIKGWTVRKMTFADIFGEREGEQRQDTEHALVYTLLCLLEELLALWAGKKAFTEVFEPAAEVVAHLLGKGKLSKSLKVSYTTPSGSHFVARLSNITHPPRRINLKPPKLSSTRISPVPVSPAARLSSTTTVPSQSKRISRNSRSHTTPTSARTIRTRTECSWRS